MAFKDELFAAFTYNNERLDLTGVDFDIRSRLGWLLGVGNFPDKCMVEQFLVAVGEQWKDIRSPNPEFGHFWYVETANGLDRRELRKGMALPSPCVLLFNTGLRTKEGEDIYLRIKVRTKPMQRGGTLRQKARSSMRREAVQFVLADRDGRPLSGFFDLPFYISNLPELTEALKTCLGGRFNLRMLNANVVEAWWRASSPVDLPLELDVGLADRQGSKVTLRLEESYSGGTDIEESSLAKIPCVIKLIKDGHEYETQEFMPQFYQTISKLAFKHAWRDLVDMAQKGEPWDILPGESNESKAKGALENYLKITFKKLQDQTAEGRYPAIVPRDKGAAMLFCTGLVTEVTKNCPEERFIYGYCSDRKDGLYTKIVWITSMDPRAEAQADDKFFPNHNLPWPALWTADPSQLVYQYNLGSPRNSDGKKGWDGFGFHHMLNHNSDRFPKRYLTGQLNEFQKPKVANPTVLMSDISKAWKSAKKRLCVNYKWAVPTFYVGALDGVEEDDRKYSPVCLLVPLFLTPGKDEPDVALVLRRQLLDGDPNKPYYFAPTCLTLEMARNNARVITRLDSTWLSMRKR